MLEMPNGFPLAGNDPHRTNAAANEIHPLRRSLDLFVTSSEDRKANYFAIHKSV